MIWQVGNKIWRAFNPCLSSISCFNKCQGFAVIIYSQNFTLFLMMEKYVNGKALKIFSNTIFFYEIQFKPRIYKNITILIKHLTSVSGDVSEKQYHQNDFSLPPSARSRVSYSALATRTRSS